MSINYALLKDLTRLMTSFYPSVGLIRLNWLEIQSKTVQLQKVIFTLLFHYLIDCNSITQNPNIATLWCIAKKVDSKVKMTFWDGTMLAFGLDSLSIILCFQRSRKMFSKWRNGL